MAVVDLSLTALHFPWDAIKVAFEGEAICGAVGGPLVVGLLTPQRNAMTLAAKNTESSLFGLYRQVFAAGFVRGFRGASKPVMAAVPQFTAIGPVYLMAERKLQSPLAAMAMASVIESTLTYSAQRRNAQIQYNATRAPADRLTFAPLTQVTGPGFGAHILRNITAMAGIRLFSPFSQDLVRRLPGASLLGKQETLVASDFVSSVAAATLSMPFNHVFSWASCTPELQKASNAQRAKAAFTFIFKIYQEQGAGLLARDLAVRINYTAFLFTAYRSVERYLTS